MLGVIDGYRIVKEQVPEAAVVASLDEMARPIRGVIVANEVADNLSAAVALRRDLTLIHNVRRQPPLVGPRRG